MKLRRSAALLAALLPLVLSAPAAAQAPPLGPAGNGIFNVYVNPAGGVGVGDYTVTTGTSNPAGSGLNVLFGNGQPNTTYMEVADTNSADNPSGGQTVYVEGGFVVQPDQVNLDSYPATVLPIGTTGYETTWTIGQPDLSSITQVVQVHGATAANSSVEVTTSIQGAPGATFNVQYLWDYQLGDDDGPVLQTEDASGQFDPFADTTGDETTYAGSGVPTTYTVTSKYRSPTAPPAWAVGATATGGPSFVAATPTPTATLQYACWERAVLADIDSYTTTSGFDIASPSSTCLGPDGPDSAVIYQFPTSTLDGSGGASVSESLFMSPPDPTSMTATTVTDNGKRSYITATLTDTKYSQPIAGRKVVFTSSGATLCSATTDATGTAVCTHQLAAGATVNASYAGSPIWAPASAQAAVQAPALGPAGNGIFNVYVNPAGGPGVGDYTVTTGANNPAGSGLNVLFGDGRPDSSYMELADANPADNPGGGRTVYVEGGLADQPDQVNLDFYPVTVVPIGTTGFKTTWTISGKPDLTAITQIVRVGGSTAANSSVEVTTVIQGAPGATFNVQYLWDYQLAGDDGPVLQSDGADGQFDPFAGTTGNETTFTGSGVPSTYTLTSAYRNPGTPPAWAIGATATGGPSFLQTPPTATDTLQYACWEQAVLADIDSYTTTSGFDIASPSSTCVGPDGPDSAVIYQLPASVLNGSGGATVSESLFMSPSAPDSTSMTATAVNHVLHEKQSYVTATLTDAKYSQPIPGRKVVFTFGTATLCSAVTDSNGVATCLHPLTNSKTPIIASYAGSPIWAPVQATAKRVTNL